MKKLSWAGLLGLCAVGLICYAEALQREEKRKWTIVSSNCELTMPLPGKMADLHARFRDHTCKLFEKHGMTIIGFWSPDKAEDADKKLIYILAFPSKEAKDKAWKAFQADPEWTTARTESEKNGKLVEKVESVMMNPTDYSAMK